MMRHGAWSLRRSTPTRTSRSSTRRTAEALLDDLGSDDAGGCPVRRALTIARSRRGHGPRTGGRRVAHPLGNFTINHYSGIHVSPDEIRVDYVIDMAEIPAFQEMEAIDTDGDGEGSDARARGLGRAKHPSSPPGSTSPSTDATCRSRFGARGRSCCPGRAGCRRLRFEATSRRAAPEQGALAYTDGELRRPDRLARDHGGRRGRRGPRGLLGARRQRQRCPAGLPAGSAGEPARRHGHDGLVPAGVSVPESSSSPDATGGSSARPAWNPARSPRCSPTRGSAVAGHGAGGGVRRVARPAARPRQDADGRLHGGIEGPHAPGVLGGHGGRCDAHGLGLRARAAVLSLERTFRPESLYPWLGLVSGLVALALGVHLLISRLSVWRSTRPATTHDHDHDHDHEQAHDHGLGRHSARPARGTRRCHRVG